MPESERYSHASFAPDPRAAFVVAAATCLLLLTSPAASAHGVSGGGRSTPEFVWLGITHMLLGWDHLLFVAGVALIAGTARRAAALVSLFALGHSVTLISASLIGWRVSPVKVDLVIGLSVVVVGLVAWFARPRTQLHWRLFGAAVVGFGLIHGLGLSTRLRDIDVHGVDSLGRIVAFNVGVEVGQVIALLVVAFIAGYLPARLTSAKAQRYAAMGLVVLGLAAAVLVVVERYSRPAPVTAAASGPCGEGSPSGGLPVGQGGHPGKDFFEPTETAPLDDFGHVLGDGYVIVQYQPTLPTDQLDALRAFIIGKDGARVAGGARTDLGPVLTATHRLQTLTCTGFDLAALQDFTKQWFADARSRTQ
ncbi:HupE/UreJ family protein [Dactylosporangium roseum]|uniref:HupE/UreJ family protein n=1 Tax=Dactylosporangium roseum TaxID=47989 RepID=A0ABY5Z3F9_9ACTN|nr:HupE/UreJ family protein [Dactylosporangium roseum]UWZ36347.1 HupE/UreJ family protein [Dactylosporangium roseum]